MLLFSENVMLILSTKGNNAYFLLADYVLYATSTYSELYANAFHEILMPSHLGLWFHLLSFLFYFMGNHMNFM